MYYNSRGGAGVNDLDYFPYVFDLNHNGVIIQVVTTGAGFPRLTDHNKRKT